MKELTCCFTGHRVIPKEQRVALQVRLEKTLRDLIDRGYRYFGAGGALGFDTMAAQTVLQLRKEYPQIKLILVLPCQDQATRWRAEDQAIYESIKKQANKVKCLQESYTADCMHKRNRHLVDYSSVCLCYLVRASGGTAYTVNYAREQGLEIINVAPKME